MCAQTMKSWGGLVAIAAGLWALAVARSSGPLEDTAARPRQPAELADALRSGDAEGRRQAAAELGLHGRAALPALTPLLEALRDPDVLLRANAAATLARMGPAAVPALVNALRDPNLWVRRGVAFALSCLRDSSPATLAALSEALDDADADVRTSAAKALEAARSANAVSGTVPSGVPLSL